MRTFSLTRGTGKNQKRWPCPVNIELDEFEALLLDCRFGKQKDGPCFLPGGLVGNERKAAAVEYLDWIVYDIDGAQSASGPSGIDAKLEEAGLLAFRYTSHNNRSNKTEISTDKYAAWAKSRGMPEQPRGAEDMRAYCDQNKKTHLKNIEFDAQNDERHFRHGEDGMVHVIYHDEVEKNRVVFPLMERLEMARLSKNSKVAIATYKAVYHAIAEKVGLKHDTQCDDPSRIYYFPSAPVVGTQKLVGFRNHPQPRLLDYSDYLPSDKPEFQNTKSGAKQADARANGDHSRTFDGHVNDKTGVRYDLIAWSVANPQFDIEELLREHLPREDIKSNRVGKSGFHISCPFEGSHSTPGGEGTFAANGDEEQPWTVCCMHDGCKGRKRAEYVASWLEAGHFDVNDLTRRSRDPKAEFEVKVASLNPVSTADQVESVLSELCRLGAGNVYEEDLLKRIAALTGKNVGALRAAMKTHRKSAKSERAKSQATGAQADKLALVNWTERDPEHVRQQIAAEFCRRNKATPKVFARGTDNVRVVRDATMECPVIDVLSNASFAAEIEKHVTFGLETDAKFKFVDCPPNIAEKLRLSDLDLPVLRDLKDTPFFTAEGELVMEPGYHSASGVYLQPPKDGLMIADVPSEPSPEDVERAKELILQPFQDFPFHDGERGSDGKASRENVLAMIVTSFVREMVGCVPMFAFDKPAHGVGGSLLASAISTITSGREPSIETVKSNSDEWTKTLHSHALNGTREILIDNVPRDYTIDDPALAAAGTADRLSGRILGASRIGGGHVRWLLAFTGVNLTFSFENARRTVPIRLDAEVSNPSGREGFAIPDLLQWLKENRAELIWGCLVLVRHWLASGKPAYSGKILGSFERWSKVVGGILECSDFTAFNTNRHLLEGKDSAGIEELLQAILDRFGETWVPCGKLEYASEISAKPSTLAELYASMDDVGYIGISRKREHFETLGPRLGTKLTEYKGGTYSLVTRRFSAWEERWDFRIDKKKTAQANLYSLGRVPGSRVLEVIDRAYAEAIEEACRDFVAEMADEEET